VITRLDVGVQLSVAETSPTTLGITASQFAFAVKVRLEAQVVIVGGVVSFTVTVKVQLGPWSLAQVTVVVPTWKADPDAGVHVTVPQFPLVVGAE